MGKFTNLCLLENTRIHKFIHIMYREIISGVSEIPIYNYGL